MAMIHSFRVFFLSRCGVSSLFLHIAICHFVKLSHTIRNCTCTHINEYNESLHLASSKTIDWKKSGRRNMANENKMCIHICNTYMYKDCDESIEAFLLKYRNVLWPIAYCRLTCENVNIVYTLPYILNQPDGSLPHFLLHTFHFWNDKVEQWNYSSIPYFNFLHVTILCTDILTDSNLCLTF